MKKYSEQALQYFHDLSHAGEVECEGDRYVGSAGRIENGERVVFTLVFQSDFCIQCRFKVYGSVPVMAVAECLARWVEGKSKQVIQEGLTPEYLLQQVNLPLTQRHAAYLVLQALNDALLE